KQVDENRPEKALLREALEGWLPDAILWRTKAQFGEGSGETGALPEAVSEDVTDEAVQRERFDVDPPLRTGEELAYDRSFAEQLENANPERIVSRLAEV